MKGPRSRGPLPAAAGPRPPLRVPGSKSLSQRCLVLAALGNGPCRLAGLSDGRDSLDLGDALARFGATVARIGGDALVTPARLRAPVSAVPGGEGGTTTRFLAALSLLVDGPWDLGIHPAMRRRPLAPMWEVLETAGVRVVPSPDGAVVHLERVRPCPPRLAVDASQSSQFASALALVAPRLPGGLEVVLAGDIVSASYLDLTIDALRSFGVGAVREGSRLSIPATPPSARRVEIDGDWSLAALWMVLGRITGRPVPLAGLRPDSPQGDRVAPALLDALDGPGPRDLDLRDVPDLLPPLAVAALFARAATRFHGIAHVRGKESDRIAGLVRELGRVGARLSPMPDGLVVEPAALAGPAILDPQGDHRMAMAFAVLGERVAGISVADPGCVAKSYPGFWDDLAAVR